MLQVADATPILCPATSRAQEVVLKAEKNADGTPKDMKSKINTAIQNNKVIIFDGSEGDFIISSTIGLPSSRGTGKTLLGINNARLCTKWYVTPEIKEALDKVNVKSKSSSSGTGGTLSNGESVDEEREFVTRQTIIDQTGDKSESCRKAGIFSFSNLYERHHPQHQLRRSRCRGRRWCRPDFFYRFQTLLG